MSRLHAIELHLLMLAGIAFLCVSGWQVWTAATEAKNTLKTVNSLVPTAAATLQKLNLELDETHRLTLEAGLTAMEARKASAMELKYLPQWNAQIGQTMTNANQTITAIQGAADAASQTLHGASLTLSTMNDSLAATKPLLEASTATVKHADAVISNPAIPKIETHIQGMTDSGDKMLYDAQWKTHQLLHPAKKKLGFWGGFWVGMQYVHKMMPSIF